MKRRPATTHPRRKLRRGHQKPDAGDGDAGAERLRRFREAVEGPLGYSLDHPERVHGIEAFLRRHVSRLQATPDPILEAVWSRAAPLLDGLDAAVPDERVRRLKEIRAALNPPTTGADGAGDHLPAAVLPEAPDKSKAPGKPETPDNPVVPETRETPGLTRTPSPEPPLSPDTPIQFMKGVGPARAAQLEKLSVATIQDAVEHLPRRYEDRREIRPISRVRAHQVETVSGVVRAIDVVTMPRRRMKIVEAMVDDGRGRLTAKWFNRTYLKTSLPPGTRVVLTGMVKPAYRSSGLEMENPEFETIGDDEPHIHTQRIVPVYPLTDGWSARAMRRLLHKIVVERGVSLPEVLPEWLRKRHGFPGVEEAIQNVHFPEGAIDVEVLNEHKDPWRRRLAFEELFLLEIILARARSGVTESRGIRFDPAAPSPARMIHALPFRLTGAQERVIREIRDDMSSPRGTHRLIQGDVGCGKTVVALAAMLVAVDSGYQAALMAPTEILAEQHYLNIRQLVEPLGLEPELFTSGRKTGRSPENVSLVVGTHALIQERMSFANLGLVVIDEQHRFGVAQRATLREKGSNPDVLVMTATPIPRTLCLTLYGDLDVSVIDELPPGRTPVNTSVVMPSQREAVFREAGEALSEGRQVYVVFPLVEESEKLDLKSAMDGFDEIRARFPDREVGLLHGKMNADEKAGTMARFKDGSIGILVATTVIEVGVDVPNATVMIIEHGERFGLSQLHQLRGRVGRGTEESRCILVAYPPLSDDGRRRLSVMERTTDGFAIAEADLEIRGPGEFFGTRQAGVPDLRIAHLIRDLDLLETARREAFALVERDPGLESVPEIRAALERRWPERLKNIQTG